ncbi:MAG: TuaD [Parcubacteria group bacterium GW2011_GWA2_40_23]|nr:MAG: TuaD [Parcubacteria group bacterium GW2011_GWA2_40_23]
MGLDSRIGHKFLKAGLGYGGSCFPKDVRALQSISGENGYQFQLLKVVIDVNNHQRWKFFHKIKNILGDLNNKEITIWGLAFKANTDDIRESIAIDLALKLIEEGAKVRVYDPKAMENACKVLGQENVVYFFNALDACHGADALIIGTEWPEFQEIDIVQLRNVMKSQIIFDGRNLLDKNKLLNLDFKYYSIGR